MTELDRLIAFIEFLSKLLSSDVSLVFTLLLVVLLFYIVYRHRSRLFDRFETELVEPLISYKSEYELLPIRPNS